MTDDDKKVFQDKAAQEKVRYEKQKKEFDETGKFSNEKTAEESDKEKA